MTPHFVTLGKAPSSVKFFWWRGVEGLVKSCCHNKNEDCESVLIKYSAWYRPQHVAESMSLSVTAIPRLRWAQALALCQWGNKSTEGPFQCPWVGSCLTPRNESSERHTRWQSKRLYWEGASGQRAAGKGSQEHCSATCLAVSGYMVMGLVSGSSLADHLAWHIFGLTQVPRGGRHIS